MEGPTRTRCCGRQPEAYRSTSIDRDWSQQDAGPLHVGTVRCMYCGTLLMDPIPSPQQMAAHFADMAYRSPDQEDARRRQKIGTYETAVALAQRFGRQADDRPRACDFGSAQGHGLEVLAAHGYEAFGVELDADAVRHSRAKGHTVYHGADLSVLDSVPPLDAIYCIDVLYYVADPFGMLETAHRFLRPGGVLLVRMSVWGETAYLASRLSSRSARLRQYASALLCDHVVGYSPRSFRSALTRAGYRVVAERVDPSFSHLRRDRTIHWHGLRVVSPVMRLLTGGRLHLLPSPIFVAQRPGAN
ncbi:MAG: class I SAM-dependent methyltransferase [Armatimonadetes bacterium]|nr:class I SAM-dependent methyltransferase [Armatimonadota bacterium]